jgi:hypothetical protein
MRMKKLLLIPFTINLFAALITEYLVGNGLVWEANPIMRFFYGIFGTMILMWLLMWIVIYFTLPKLCNFIASRITNPTLCAYYDVLIIMSLSAILFIDLFNDVTVLIHTIHS